MKRIAGTLAALLALALLLAWGLGFFAAEAATPAPIADASRPATAPERSVEAARPDEAAGAPRAAIPVVADADLVIVRGRCVDAASKAPLAGCRVAAAALRFGHYADERRLLQRAGAPWPDPEARTTGADGRFELKFTPPPWTLKLAFELQGRVPRERELKGLMPGAVVALGDVGMEPGILVSGRVTDTAGALLGGATVRLSQFRLPSTGTVPHRIIFTAQTGADGRFTIGDPMRAGICQVFVTGKKVVRPAEATIRQDAAHLEVVVRSPAESDAIRGTVVDAADQPVEGVTVRQRSHGAVLDRTDASGRFALVPMRPFPDKVVLSVDHIGFELLLSEPIAWGTKDVVLRLRRGVDVPLLVLDDETGAPIEAYGVRVLGSAAGTVLQHIGRHPHGRLLLPGMRRGALELRIEACEPGFLEATHACEVEDGGTPEQVVRLRRRATRLLQVVRGDGQPVAGSRIELVHPRTPGEPVTTNSETGTTADFRWAGRKRLALRVCTGPTDARGELELSGPPGVDLGLLLHGPGHVAKAVNGVRLDHGLGPLRVEVSAGARLVGRVRPANLAALLGLRPETLERYRQRGDEASIAHLSPNIVVGDEGSHAVRPTTPVSRGLIAAEGTFEVTAIAAGTWPISLSYYFDSGRGGFAPHREPLGEVTLRDGEVRRVEYDLTRLVPGEMDVLFRLDGRPLAGAQVNLSSQTAGRAEHTGADGRIRTKLQPGSYTASVQVTGSGGNFVGLPVAAPIVVASGAVARQTVDLRTRHLRIRLLRPDGAGPAAGVELRVIHDAERRWSQSQKPRTGADGTATYEHLLAGTYRVEVWPKDLSDAAAQRQWQKEHRGTWRDALLFLGNVVVVEGTGPQDAELTLPAGSGY